jgi:hypothetical protein
MSIEGEGGAHIRVQVPRYEAPDRDDVADTKWLAANVALTRGSFNGAERLDLTTDDFLYFNEALTTALAATSGVAEFETLEQTLFIRVAITPAGHATVSARLRSLQYRETELACEFETDVTFLRRTEREIQEIVAAFPRMTNE